MPNRITEGTLLEGDIEGFGISFAEAGACGNPVIEGLSGGTIEAVLDGETGLIVDPTSESEVTGAISSLLDDTDKGVIMGKRARQRIEKEFDWRILAENVLKIL